MIALGLLLAAALATGPGDETVPTTLYRPDMFKTLVDPDCSHCVDEARRKAGSLRDDDRVLAWIRGEYTGGAIPYRWFLVPHRVISDTYGVFVYDADADFVRGWPASVDFRFHGWRNGVMVMRHKDGTLFDCLTGVAFEGPRKGEQLTPLPTIESDWGPWLKANPGTVAYEMVAKFQPQSLPQSVLADSRHAPANARLVFKLHPLDPGMVDYERVVKRLAAVQGVTDRIMFLDGGNLNVLARRARGAVTINSTAGLATIGFGCPTKVLGRAVYDIEGLTDRTPLNRFWNEPQAPDHDLFRRFRHVMMERTQINGAFYTPVGMRLAATAAAQRLGAAD